CACDLRVDGARQGIEEASCPCPIGRDQVLARPDRGGHDPIAGNEFWRQTPRNTRADNAFRTARNRRTQRRLEPYRGIAKDGNARAAGDGSFKRETRNRNDAALPRHSCPLFPVLMFLRSPRASMLLLNV